MLGVASVALWAAGCTWPKPSADPISRWEFDETSSAEGVFEDRGPAHVLMIHAGTWADLTTDPLVAGDDGTSAYTDGSAYATIPADVPAYNLAAITISFYYQRESASDKHILLAAGNGSQGGDFSLEVLPNGRLRAWHTGQDDQLRFFEGTGGITGTSLQVGTAHRIDLSLGPQGARIYLDGVELPAAAIPANTNGWNNGRVKYLGRWTDGVQAPAAGVFDRLRIWNQQLAGAEIAELEAAQSISLPGGAGRAGAARRGAFGAVPGGMAGQRRADAGRHQVRLQPEPRQRQRLEPGERPGGPGGAEWRSPGQTFAGGLPDARHDRVLELPERPSFPSGSAGN